MSDAKRRTDVAIEEARKLGFDVIMGDNDHLLLDLDTPEQLAQYEIQKHMANDVYGLVEVSRWNSINDHWHVLAKLKRPLEAAQRVAVQAALGSDPRREMLAVNLLLQYPNEEPCILFKPTPIARANYKPIC